jgi:methyl-accepting chemotaxis protein
MHGISFFENLSIQRKIGLGFGLTSLLFIIVVWQYQVTLYRTLNSFEQLQSVHVAQKIHSLNIHRYMLEARRSEKDFLARKGPEYVERVNKYVDLVLEEAVALQAVEKQNDTPAVAERIRERMGIYHEAFQDIVEAWKIKGLDYQSGLQGRFRETIHQVESKAESFRTGAIYLTLLQIRRAEKDLGLRRADEYAERVHDLGNRFREQVSASALDAQSKVELSSAMDDYLAAFDQYAARVMRDNDAAGGKGRFRDVAHRLEDLLRHHYVPDLEEDILMLRRHEKDYLLRGDKSYTEKARLVIEDILNNISNSEIPDGEKDDLREQVHEYEKDFLALVEQNDRIVVLTAQMRQAVHQIEPLVAANVQDAITHMEQAGEATRERSRKNAFLTLSLSAAAILLGIVFSVLMARRITRPVATLMALAALVTGRGSESGEEEKKDEIAALAGAMGRMAGSHQQMLLRLGEHADSLEAAASGLSTACRTLDDLAGETKTDLPDREKSVREIGELGDLLRQLNDDLADTTEGLRKLLDRYEEW